MDCGLFKFDGMRYYGTMDVFNEIKGDHCVFNFSNVGGAGDSGCWLCHCNRIREARGVGS